MIEVYIYISIYMHFVYVYIYIYKYKYTPMTFASGNPCLPDTGHLRLLGTPPLCGGLDRPACHGGGRKVAHRSVRRGVGEARRNRLGCCSFMNSNEVTRIQKHTLLDIIHMCRYLSLSLSLSLPPVVVTSIKVRKQHPGRSGFNKSLS